MTTKPTLQNDSHPAQAIEISARIAHRVGGRILNKVREALPPTIFFFVDFNFIVLTTNLLGAPHIDGVQPARDARGSAV